ncbi:MAG: zinc ABC transporter substrate-binding protein [Solirubrobacteraceae bacterium]
MAVRRQGEGCRSRSRGRAVWPARPRMLAAVACALVAAGLAGCDKSGPSATAGTGGGGRLRVVAAENFWGSIASQLGGSRVDVSSIIVNPDTDPHSYEPTAADARTIAGAGLAIVNGIGYDNWAPKLLAASPGEGRVVLNVGEALGLKDGDNPHQWYSPASVRRIVGAIVADYDRLDPADAGYYAAQEKVFETKVLARYDELRAQIRARYAGTPVGYSESIFRPLGEDLGLRLMTSYSFAKAIAEGGEVTAQDKRTVDEQAEHGQIKVWVFNSQNVTPDVQRVNEIARAHGIPIATVTETLAPAGDTFEQWQAAQLEGLERALRAGTGR